MGIFQFRHHLTLLLAMSALLPLQAEEREFTDTMGRTLKAEIISVEGDSCILNVDNQKFKVPFANLSEPDQEFLREWRPPAPQGKPELKVNFSDRVNRGENEDTQSINLEVTLENADSSEKFPGGNLVIISIMRHTKERGIYCKGFREEKIVPPLDRLEEKVYESKRYVTKFSSDKGWRYHGHLVLLYNNQDELVAQAVSSGLSVNDRILEAPVHGIIDSRYREVKIKDHERDKYSQHMMPKAAVED